MTIEQACRTLRLPTIRDRFPELLAAAQREQLTYEAFVSDLLLAECEDRDRRRSVRRVRAAGFLREKHLADLNFDANPNVNPATIADLASGEWVRLGHPLCLIGDSGTGKTHLLIGLGIAAAEAGYRVKYTLATRRRGRRRPATGPHRRPLRAGRPIARGRTRLHGTRQTWRRITLPSFGRARRRELHRRRRQRGLLRLDENIHQPPAMRGDRRPNHLPRQHHRHRHRLLPLAHTRACNGL